MNLENLKNYFQSTYELRKIISNTLFERNAEYGDDIIGSAWIEVHVVRVLADQRILITNDGEQYVRSTDVAQNEPIRRPGRDFRVHRDQLLWYNKRLILHPNYLSFSYVGVRRLAEENYQTAH